MRFAIRDDDASYFTDAEELDRLWTPFLRYLPVSFAVVPASVEPFHPGDPVRFHQGTDSRELAGNPELVAWLRSRLALGSIAVMCHGYSHEYRRTGPAQLQQEYIWKPVGRLARETVEGKRIMEATLGCEVDTFVPPGNAISGAGLGVVRASFANVLTTLPLRRPQDFRPGLAHASAYARRLYYQVRHGIANPFGERLDGLNFLSSVSVTSRATWEDVRSKLLLCHRLNANFIAAVHYWEIDKRLKDILWRAVDLAHRLNCDFRTCPEMFDNRRCAGRGLNAEGAECLDSRISSHKTPSSASSSSRQASSAAP